MTALAVRNSWNRHRRVSRTVGLTIILCALFADFLLALVRRWSTEPRYFHGFFVLPVAVGIAYLRRRQISACSVQSSWWGLTLMLCAGVLHWSTRHLAAGPASGAGLLIFVAGMTLLVWGKRVTVTLLPSIGFLIFMFPLPTEMETALSEPLRILGARAAAWNIQMFGIPAYADGGMIHVSEMQLDPACAFSGVRMLPGFVAVSVAAIIVSQRTRREKLLILCSAAPIALTFNVARVVATAVVFHSANSAMAELVFGDLSGWLGVPAAVLLLYLELRLLDWLLVEARDPLARVSASRHTRGAIQVLPTTDGP